MLPTARESPKTRNSVEHKGCFDCGAASVNAKLRPRSARQTQDKGTQQDRSNELRVCREAYLGSVHSRYLRCLSFRDAITGGANYGASFWILGDSYHDGDRDVYLFAAGQDSKPGNWKRQLRRSY